MAQIKSTHTHTHTHTHKHVDTITSVSVEYMTSPAEGAVHFLREGCNNMCHHERASSASYVGGGNRTTTSLFHAIPSTQEIK